jgi:insulysin
MLTIPTTAEHDAAHLTPLTKEDILKFFDAYISPTSSTRAKLSVQLHAQNTASSIIENASPEEQSTILTTALTKLFAAHNIDTDTEALGKRLRGRRLSLSDPAPMAEAVTTYLTEDAKVEGEKAREVVQQGLVALGGATSKEEKKEVAGGREPVVIEDVHAWKASLVVDAGAQAVRPLSDFEDIESKL